MSRDRVAEWLDEHAEDVAALSDAIGRWAEPGLGERRSAAALISFLEAHGFAVRAPVAGMATAFVAERGSGSPVIAMMCEYDATPGDSQHPVPRPAPIDPGAGGFPDLHNGIGTASAAAAVAAAETLAADGRAGTIRVYGTPAEKLCIGKPVLAAHGLLDDMDCMIAWHPRPYTTLELDTGPGCYQAQIFDFAGLSAYASAPWVGVSAVDAMVLMNVIVQFMREHIPRHYVATVNEVFTGGGQHPTALPTHAQAWYVSRANTREGIEHVQAMLERAAQAACLATGASYKARVVAATRPWLPNRTLADHCMRALEHVGAPQVPASMLPFAAEMLEELGREPVADPFDTAVTPLDARITAEFAGGADDVTEFCWHAPTARIYVAYGLRWPRLPNWAGAAMATTPAAHATVLCAARAMAESAVGLVAQPEVLGRAQAEWRERTAAGGTEPLLEPGVAVPDLHFPPAASLQRAAA